MVRIWRKEMLDILRDRRTLWVMILAPLVLMPLFMMAGPIMMERQQRAAEQSRTIVGFMGGRYAPKLVDGAKQASFDVVDLDEDTGEAEDAAAAALAALKSERVDVVVLLPAGASEQLESERPVDIRVFYLDERSKSSVGHSAVQQWLMAVGQQAIQARLAARGVSPDVMTPLRVETKNLTSEEEVGGLVLGMVLPFMIIIWATAGGMYAAIDLVAGEKERGTLEVLLVTPPGRFEIVLGKFFAVLSVAYAAVFLALASMTLTVKFGFPLIAPPGESLDVKLSGIGMATVMVVSLLLTAMVSGLQLVLSAFGRNFKETQNYMTALMMVGMVPGVFFSFMPEVKFGTAIFLVPMMNVLAVIREVLSGQVDWVHVGLTLGSSALCALGAIALAVATFRRENVVFRT